MIPDPASFGDNPQGDIGMELEESAGQGNKVWDAVPTTVTAQENVDVAIVVTPPRAIATDKDSSHSADTNPNQAANSSGAAGNPSNSHSNGSGHNTTGGTSSVFQRAYEGAEHAFGTACNAATVGSCWAPDILNEPEVAMSRLCGQPSSAQAFTPRTNTNTAPLTSHSLHSPSLMELLQTTATKRPSTLSPPPSVPPPSPERSTVKSQTHEDIEITVDQLVQVRLPPTHPVLTDLVEDPLPSPPVGPPVVEPIIKPIVKSIIPIVPLVQPLAAVSETSVTVSPDSKTAAPVAELSVQPEQAAALERSISELTMRSSYAATDSVRHPPASMQSTEFRRMAYYAVGRHSRQTNSNSTGGNRRCYFSGKLILGGSPFYAGCVRQGLRTLVVFCLPSALGLPDKDVMHQLQNQHKTNLWNRRRTRSHGSSAGPSGGNSTSSGTTSSPSLRGLRLLKSATNGSSSKASHYSSLNGSSLSTPPQRLGKKTSMNGRNSSASQQTSKSFLSRFSSLDDLSLSVEGDLDANWHIEHDVMLQILPPVSSRLLQSMATLYGDQFETLPVQVRDASQWQLYVKFCFFSGLPIADGELHYKVRDDIAEQVYGEEIALSHDVMEASAGASAEILTLPNRTVMRYLQRHYGQQCEKLDDRVFQRSNWLRMAPEV